mmetsp:Transcript_1922/g.5576  ORF Transcript_1922/g.5576 Transcript_1922/m.5576 type:complete len:436 (-) Transcript_1922:145-1452(-)
MAEDPVQKLHAQVEGVVGQLERVLELGKPIDEDAPHDDADFALVGKPNATRACSAAVTVVAVISRSTVDAHHVEGGLPSPVEGGQGPLMAGGGVGQVPVVVTSILGQVGGGGVETVGFGRVVGGGIGTDVHVLDGQQVQIDHTLGRGAVLVVRMMRVLLVAAILSLLAFLIGIDAHVLDRTGSGGRHQIRRGISRGGIAVLGFHPQSLLDGGTLDGKVVRPRRRWGAHPPHPVRHGRCRGGNPAQADGTANGRWRDGVGLLLRLLVLLLRRRGGLAVAGGSALLGGGTGGACGGIGAIAAGRLLPPLAGALPGRGGGGRRNRPRLVLHRCSCSLRRSRHTGLALVRRPHPALALLGGSGRGRRREQVRRNVVGLGLGSSCSRRSRAARCRCLGRRSRRDRHIVVLFDVATAVAEAGRPTNARTRSLLTANPSAAG